MNASNGLALLGIIITAALGLLSLGQGAALWVMTELRKDIRFLTSMHTAGHPHADRRDFPSHGSE